MCYINIDILLNISSQVTINICIKGEDRKSAEEMDALRQKMLAYEYLCHLEEAKK